MKTTPSEEIDALRKILQAFESVSADCHDRMRTYVDDYLDSKQDSAGKYETTIELHGVRLTGFDSRARDVVPSDPAPAGIGGRVMDGYMRNRAGDIGRVGCTYDSRMSESPVYCDHANEFPAICPCSPACYCQYNSCRGRAPIERSPK